MTERLSDEVVRNWVAAAESPGLAAVVSVAPHVIAALAREALELRQQVSEAEEKLETRCRLPRQHACPNCRVIQEWTCPPKKRPAPPALGGDNGD